MLMSMLISHASVDLFVLPCAYAYVASEDMALGLLLHSAILNISSGNGCFCGTCLSSENR